MNRRQSGTNADVDCVIPEAQQGERLDRALASLLPGLSASRIARLVRQGAVLCNGRPLGRTSAKAKLGDRYRFSLPLAEAAQAQLEELYADGSIIGVNKPSGLLAHGTGQHAEATLADLADARWGPLPQDAGHERPGIVHRLDRETSGVIVLARTSAAMASLRAAFKQRSVQKRYLALVHGSPALDSWCVEAALGPASPGSLRDRDRQKIDPSGKPSETRFEVVSRQEGRTWVACMPLTGRRHQIRVHLFEGGLPIVADPLYRGPKLAGGDPPRLALHAQSLTLEHPDTGQPWSIQADLPADLAPWLHGTR